MRALPLLALLAVACIKPAPIPQATDNPTIQVAALLQDADGTQLEAAPERFLARLEEVLAARSVRTDALDVTSQLDALGDRTTLESRVALLDGDDKPLLLLVETRAMFSVQVNGRYRWNVEADISLVPDGDSGRAQTRSVRVPVALIYSHQGPADALEDATPLIARQLASLVDEWIASRG